MTSAVPWAAIAQAEGVAEAAETAIENHLPKRIEQKLPGHHALSGSSTADTETSSDLEKEQSLNQDQDVKRLAREITQHSIRTSGGNDYPNPFHSSNDPALDPNSGQFRPESWIRTLIGITSRDPQRYPQRTAGISYRNLNVHGFGSLTDYQKYVSDQSHRAVVACADVPG